MKQREIVEEDWTYIALTRFTYSDSYAAFSRHSRAFA
jgi:hypothetical protein